MSAPALAAPRLPAAPAPAALPARSPAESLAVRAAAFGLLSWFGAYEWSGLIVGPPSGRMAAVAAIVTAGGAGLALAPRLPAPRALRAALSVLIVLAVAAAALVAAGLPLRLLAPAHWAALGDGLDRGLAGASSTSWPYVGTDPWVRLTLLLGVPAVAVPAMVLAFWPPARGRVVARAAGLVLLIGLVAVPTTERAAGAPLLRGALLLALVAAWLWLPRLGRRQLVPALVALGAAGLIALPMASALERHVAWIDYTKLDLFANGRGGQGFEWSHRYGPLDWPRTGATMLEVRSPHPHYWKVETLDRFDGLRWSHSDAGNNADPTSELPAGRDTRWDERIHFTVRGLRSDLLVAAGTVYAVQGPKIVAGSGDGTVRVLDGPIGRGDDYTVQTYVPDPTAAQMRAARRRFQTQFLSYTYVDLPRPTDSAITAPPPVQEAGNLGPRTLGAATPGEPIGASPAVRKLVLASPYARAYRLARRLAAGQPTAYDVVRSVERHLQKGFVYDERPPLRRLPLDAFLFRDRRGYCQQFSGAMALLLRMDGIPARVAAGFAPGIRDRANGEYRVRDLDAHSWVEVWFNGIGWVPFDPTPSLAPASAQATGDKLPSAATGGHDSGKDAGKVQKGHALGAGPGSTDSGDSALLAIVLAALLLPAIGAAALWVVVVVRARRVRRAGGDPDLRELGFALERLGHRVPAGTTLLELERRLRGASGTGAVQYVHLLRERRFASPGRAAAIRLDRRDLRRGLSEGRGPIVKLRALLVLPPWRHGGDRGPAHS